MTTIFWAPEGPLIKYDDGILYIEDLNPEIKLKWVVSSDELRRMGIAMLRTSLLGTSAKDKFENLKRAFAENDIPWPKT